MKRAFLASGLFLMVLGIALIAWGWSGSGGQGKIHLTLIDKPTVMTAAYKVYGDPEAVGGKYWLSKLTLRNEGDGSLKKVRISYQVPNYITWTTPQVYAEILPGQTIVSPFYPRFPESVAKTTSLTSASIEVKIEYDDGGGEEQTRIERRDFKLRGVQEIEYSSLPPEEILTWYDANDNAELNTAWVTEQDPAVRTYYAKISERSGGFGTMSNAKEIQQLARSAYDYMIATGMTYSGTAGVVEQRGDGYVLVQGMRLPRDVIYGNSGLCVELAQLWASLAINAGARCYLVMIPGHCFPVIQTSEFGDGSMLPIEATGIGGAFAGGNLGGPMSFEDAVKVATANFNKVRSGETLGIIIDIASYRNQGIRPPELAAIDQAAFTKMLDDRLKEQQQKMAARQRQQVQVARNTPRNKPENTQRNATGNTGGDNRSTIAGGTPWTDPAGRLTLAYPGNWMLNPQAVAAMRQMLPGYTLSVVDPATRYGLDVIFFDGVNNPDVAMQSVSNMLRSFGHSVQMGTKQAGTLGGVKGVSVPVMVQTPNGVLMSVMAIVPVKGGMVAINFGGPQEGFQGAQQNMQAIFQSVKVAR